jgi:AcrR family transcriptional regulator
MTSPTRDSRSKWARIENAAAALFAERGYEQTDLRAVAKASGAPIGSICHYFDNKGGLATRVYNVAAGRLIASVEEAIRDPRITRDYAMRQLINTCHSWNVGFPTDRKVIAALAPHVVEPVGPSIPSLEIRLGAILAAWGQAARRRPPDAPAEPRAALRGHPRAGRVRLDQRPSRVKRRKCQRPARLARVPGRCGDRWRHTTHRRATPTHAQSPPFPHHPDQPGE